jgi:hypothetical protein
MKLSLLNSLGEINSIQIKLIDACQFESDLKIVFNNINETGMFYNHSIYVNHSNARPDYFELFHRIVEITGSIDYIEGVDVLMVIHYNNEFIPVVLEVNFDYKFPMLLDTNFKNQNELINHLHLIWNLRGSQNQKDQTEETILM